MSKTKEHDKPQIDRFKEAARQLEADESEAAFDQKLRDITKKRTPKNKSDSDEKS